MHKDAKIYIAGHKGLVGSAILRKLCKEGYTNLITRTSQELDLTDQHAVHDFFQYERPTYVFLCAAKVGGILANNTYPAHFIQKNLMIQTNLIHEAMRCHVSRLLFLGSSCIYPKGCAQPIKEDYLLTGPLEFTNRPYAIAKIAGIEMCWAYNRQYNTQYICAMPTNLYGPGDNYDLKTSHVLPAIIRKMHEAKVLGQNSIKLWGDGNTRREFLYSEDLADAAWFILSLADPLYTTLLSSPVSPPIINVGFGQDITIKDLADMIAHVVEYKGAVEWDSQQPKGVLQKLLDSSRLKKLGWAPATSLQDGIKKSYKSFIPDCPPTLA